TRWPRDWSSDVCSSDLFTQRDRLALVVRDLDADGGLAGNALDQDGFGLQGQAQIFGEANNPAVLDAGFRLEFERGYDRAGVDLRDASLDVEFLALGFDGTRALLQFLFVELPAALAFVQQRRR